MTNHFRRSMMHTLIHSPFARVVVHLEPLLGEFMHKTAIGCVATIRTKSQCSGKASCAMSLIMSKLGLRVGTDNEQAWPKWW